MAGSVLQKKKIKTKNKNKKTFEKFLQKFKARNNPSKNS